MAGIWRVHHGGRHLRFPPKSLLQSCRSGYSTGGLHTPIFGNTQELPSQGMYGQHTIPPGSPFFFPPSESGPRFECLTTKGTPSCMLRGGWHGLMTPAACRPVPRRSQAGLGTCGRQPADRSSPARILQQHSIFPSEPMDRAGRCDAEIPSPPAPSAIHPIFRAVRRRLQETRGPVRCDTRFAGKCPSHPHAYGA